MRRVTLDDVARMAGVSRATASRALSGAGSVSEATQEKVRTAAALLNFIPHQAARALATSQAQAIALVIPEPDSLVLGDPFLSLVIRGVSEVFHATKYQLLLVIVHPEDPPTKAAHILRPGLVDGAIVVSQHRSGSVDQMLAGAHAPVVFIGRPWNGDSQLYVDVDNWEVGHLATSHLLNIGARRIACVAGPEDMTPVRDRAMGWTQTLHEAGLVPGPLAHGSFTRQGGEAAMKQILDKDPSIDAVFAQSDLMAGGAVHALLARGVQLPEDIKIVGVDNTEIGRSMSPRLSSVTNPAETLASRASQMLLRVLDDGADPADLTPEIIRPELVLRDSA